MEGHSKLMSLPPRGHESGGLRKINTERILFSRTEEAGVPSTKVGATRYMQA